MAVVKLLRGLKNIHFAKYLPATKTFDAPVPITFAKKVENKLNYEGEQEWADDRIVDSSYGFNGGEGTLSVLGLTANEYATLFGNTEVKGGADISANDVSPQGAFLFEKGKKGSNAKRLYVIYACTCSPSGVNGETVEGGKASSTLDEINYSISSLEDGKVMFFVDTDASDVDSATVTGWFTGVQFSKPKAKSKDKADVANEEIKKTK